MTLENYVKLRSDTWKRLKVKHNSFRIEPRTIKDPKGDFMKTLDAAVIDVIEEDGVPVEKQFSTFSEKLATRLKEGHASGDLYTYEIRILRTGEGYARHYTLGFIK